MTWRFSGRWSEISIPVASLTFEMRAVSARLTQLMKPALYPDRPRSSFAELEIPSSFPSTRRATRLGFSVHSRKHTKGLLRTHCLEDVCLTFLTLDRLVSRMSMSEISAPRWRFLEGLCKTHGTMS